MIWRMVRPGWLTRVGIVLGVTLSMGLATPWLTCWWYRDICSQLSEVRFTGRASELWKIHLSSWLKSVFTFGLYALLGFEAVAKYIDSHFEIIEDATAATA